MRARILVSCSIVLSAQSLVWGQSAPLQIVNPNWNITLTDAGYSDWLYDNTPGYQGREYLSGEWGAAVSYTKGTPGTVVSPTWLEPQFLFPDWQTNSNFTTLSPITATAFDVNLQPVSAVSTIANPDLQIDLSFVMVDTITGMPMGKSPASAASGSSIDSNRYVLRQTYTIKNISGDVITGLHLFQFLHSLNGVTSIYDNRNYPGAEAAYQYDTTQVAVDPSFSGTPGGPTFRDYIGFGSRIAPVAFDNGRYGIDPIDNHSLGKPSVGIHYSIEADALANLDYFSPVAPDPSSWVSGAQKFSLGSLAPGASVAFDVLLSVKTGTVVDTSGHTTGSANGGSSNPGGVDFDFDNVTTQGDFFAEYDPIDAAELAQRVAAGEFSMPTFIIPGEFQLYQIEFDGAFAGNVKLTFGYNPAYLPNGFDETTLVMFHFVNGAWENLGGIVDPVLHTITVTTSSLGYFGLGVAPAPTDRTITQWRSVRTHTGLGRRGIVLDPAATGNGPTGPTVETRGPTLADCGIRRIEVDFDGPITLGLDTSVAVIGRTTSSGVLGVPVSYEIASLEVSGTNTLVIRFDTGSLPDATCYSITLNPGAISETIAGDNDCEIRSLMGDATGSGDITLSDALFIQGMVGQDVASNPAMDINLSGGNVTLADAVLAKSLVTSPPRTVLCP